jgi:hypothetical protein
VVKRWALGVLAATTMAAGGLLAGGGTAAALPDGVTCELSTCTNESTADVTVLAYGLCTNGPLVPFIAYIPAGEVRYLAPAGLCPKGGFPTVPTMYL